MINYYEELFKMQKEFYDKQVENLKRLMNQDTMIPELDINKYLKATSKMADEVYTIYKKLFQGSVKESQDKVKEIFDRSFEATFTGFKNLFLDSLPEGYQNIIESLGISAYVRPYLEMQKAYYQSLSKLTPNRDELIKKFEKNQEKFMEAFLNIPMPEYSKEIIKEEQEKYTHIYELVKNFTKLYMYFLEYAAGSSKSLQDRYLSLLKVGDDPKSFEDFFKFYKDSLNLEYQKMVNSDEFKKLTTDVKTYFDINKVELNDMMETAMKNMPIVTTSKIESLSARVEAISNKLQESAENHDMLKLKKEVELLKEENKKLKAEIKNNDKESIEKEIKSIKEMVEKSSSEKSDAEKIRDELKIEIETLKNRLSETEALKEEVSKNLKEQTEKLQKFTKDNADLKRKVTLLEKKNKEN